MSFPLLGTPSVIADVKPQDGVVHVVFSHSDVLIWMRPFKNSCGSSALMQRRPHEDYLSPEVLERYGQAQQVAGQEVPLQ